MITVSITTGPEEYSHDVYSSLDQLDVESWKQVCGSDGLDLTMDVKFLRCVEESMSDQATFWYVIIRDAGGKPVACACLSEFRVDALVISGERLKKIVNFLRRGFSHLLFVKILACGPPVSIGDSALRLAPDADPSQTFKRLDTVLQSLARNSGTHFLLFKEFPDSDREVTANLCDLGYSEAESLPMNSFMPSFRSFEEYLCSLTAHYRQDIKRSRAKLDRFGFTINRITDVTMLERIYTDDVHRLYLAVVERAVNQMEALPREFFLALARQFPNSISFTYISRGNTVAAFNWAFRDERSYRLLFCGLDYELNEQAGLYFNLMYTELDNALRANVSDIHVGQAADAFKSRLGCYQSALWIYAKSLIMPGVARKCAAVLFPRPRRLIPHNIYKSTTSRMC